MGRGRAPCCAKVGLNRGTWTPEEDMRLVTYVHKYGHGNWRALPKLAGLLRCGKSCRLRWINYLRPDVKRGNFTKEEEDTIVRLHGLLGNKWSKIASRLPGRTDNEIKNVWNTHLKKRFAQRRSAQQKDEERPCSDEGDCNTEKKQIETDKIETPIEPNLDLWCSLQDIDPSVLDLLDSTSTSTTTTTATSGDHYQNSTATDLEAGLSGGDESEGWLQYLEEELELWGESSPTVTPADMEGGDAVASYFHALQSSPSPLYL